MSSKWQTCLTNIQGLQKDILDHMWACRGPLISRSGCLHLFIISQNNKWLKWRLNKDYKGDYEDLGDYIWKW